MYDFLVLKPTVLVLGRIFAGEEENKANYS